jgi:hypothetical protein
VIGNRTSTCVLDLWFTYIHYISNGFLIFSTDGVLKADHAVKHRIKRCTCITVRCIMSLYVNPL